jgi:hypothetical protein
MLELKVQRWRNLEPHDVTNGRNKKCVIGTRNADFRSKMCQVFMGSMDSFIHGFMQTGLNYESIWLKIAPVKQFLWKLFGIEFQQFLRNGL